MIFLQNHVIVYLFLQAVAALLLLFALWHVIAMLRHWNFRSSSALQYRLEKRSYLIILIITFALVLKLLLLPYFVFMLDALSAFIPGAMCAAGVIDANNYGTPLLLLKISVLFVAGIWLIINRRDLKAMDYPFFKLKLWLFTLLFMLFAFESTLDLLYLTHITTEQPVSCCSVIFGAEGVQNPLPFGLDTQAILILFSLSYLLVFITSIFKMAPLSFVANGIFLYLSYYAVVYFFGTYIYELPTHLCPYCMLQGEYHAIGYLIWGTLFLGTFFGAVAPIIGLLTNERPLYMYRCSLILNTIFMLICSGYVIRYYLLNGVWL